MKRVVPIVALLALMTATPSFGRERLSLEAVNTADLRGRPNEAALIKAEVLLDRALISPGAIDGKDGDNFKKAVAAFQEQYGLEVSGKLDNAIWDKLVATSNAPILTTYTISNKDVEGPFTRRIPSRMEKQAGLKHLNYRNPLEALAEKFHMSEALLKALNPHVRFDDAGAEIVVANVSRGDGQTKSPKVAKVVVEKGKRDVEALDFAGKLVAFYPASVGSAEKPAPSGTLEVVKISRNPTYKYNPDYAFKGVKAKHEFTIGPGPNNPVGRVWIGLNGEGYGIHGTPDPEKVGKTASHGCIRLTNWDALDLAARVDRKTPVEFVER